MAQMYDVSLTLPPVPPNEPDTIITRRVRVSINGGPFAVHDLPVVTTTYTVQAAENSVIEVTHALVDDAGLEGPESPVSRLTVLDTVPPVVSGAVVIGTPVPATPTSPPPPPAGRSLLTPADVTLLGFYTVPGTPGADNIYAKGMTLLNGNILLLSFLGNVAGVQSRPDEYALPAAFGVPLQHVRPWSGDAAYAGLGYTGTGCYESIWHDRATGRTWHAGALSYPQLPVSDDACTYLSSRVLNDDGTVSDVRGCWGLEGLGQRLLYGGIRRVPQWFRQQYGAREFLLGFGGETSRATSGRRPSLGPVFVFADDPSADPGLPWASESHTLPASRFTIAADCRTGNDPTDWYAGGYAARTKDRGVRCTPVENHYDDPARGDNPTQPPAGPPSPAAQWTSPAPGDPNGWGRATWDWRMAGIGWADDDAGTRPKHGVLAVVHESGGRGYYLGSVGYTDRKVAELHIYDPAVLAAGMAGTIPPWAVRPTHAVALDLPGLVQADGTSYNAARVQSADLDPATGRLYVLYTVVGSPAVGFGARVAVFQVGGG